MTWRTQVCSFPYPGAGCNRAASPDFLSEPLPTPCPVHGRLGPLQALKANAEAAPTDLKLNSNYITRFGQVALSEAVDMVFEMAKGKTTTVHF